MQGGGREGGDDDAGNVVGKETGQSWQGMNAQNNRENDGVLEAKLSLGQNGVGGVRWKRK